MGFGRYEYASAPDDVFRKHDKCTCTVTYECRWMRRDVWSKKKWEADPKDVQAQKEFAEQQREQLRQLDERKKEKRRKAKEAAAKAKNPRVLSKEEGSRIHNKLLTKRKGKLTGEVESGIIKSEKGSSAFSPERKNKMLRDEAIISGNTFETAIIYNADGSFAFKMKGYSDKVIFTDKQIDKMKGKVLTHNHPNGTNFSTHDINMMRYGKLQEIRACNSKGAYVLRLREAWSKELDSLDLIESAYNRIEDSLLSKHLDLKAQNGLSFSQFIQQLDDDVMTEFAKKYGLDYFWEERVL